MQTEKYYYVYIISSPNDFALYVGVTSDLQKRIYQHKSKLVDGHTKKYNIIKLVYYEMFGEIEMAIKREKQIKHWRREKKEYLINLKNPNRNDLYPSTF